MLMVTSDSRLGLQESALKRLDTSATLHSLQIEGGSGQEALQSIGATASRHDACHRSGTPVAQQALPLAADPLGQFTANPLKPTALTCPSVEPL